MTIQRSRIGYSRRSKYYPKSQRVGRNRPMITGNDAIQNQSINAISPTTFQSWLPSALSSHRPPSGELENNQIKQRSTYKRTSISKKIQTHRDTSDFDLVKSPGFSSSPFGERGDYRLTCISAEAFVTEGDQYSSTVTSLNTASISPQRAILMRSSWLNCQTGIRRQLASI